MDDPASTYLRGRAARRPDRRTCVGALWWDRDRGRRAGRRPRRAARGATPAAGSGRPASRSCRTASPRTSPPRCSRPTSTAAATPTDNSGLSFVDPARAAGRVAALDAEGFQVHVHAIGDRAVREALDAFEAARGRRPRPGATTSRTSRWCTPTTSPRFAELGVAANMQALWACLRDADGRADAAVPRRGAGRAGSTRSATCTAPAPGSSPAATGRSARPTRSPAIHVAVNRTAYGEPRPAGAEPFLPEQALTSRPRSRRTPRARRWVNHRDDAGVLAPGRGRRPRGARPRPVRRAAGGDRRDPRGLHLGRRECRSIEPERQHGTRRDDFVIGARALQIPLRLARLGATDRPGHRSDPRWPTRRSSNFINGELVDAGDGRDLRRRRPGHRRGLRHGARVGRRGRRRGVCRPRPTAFEAWRRHHARASASWRCSGSPTRSRRAPTSSSRVECREHRQAARADRSGGDPADGRPDPLLRRRGPRARGHGRPASTWQDHTSCVRREPIGVVRPGHAVELPDDDGGLEVRPGARRRQHASCSSRQRHHAGARRCCWPRSPPSSCPPGVFNVVCGDRDTGRALVEHPTPQMVVDHRLGARRHGGRRVGRRATSSGSTSSSAARRRSSSSTTPTSRPRPRASRGRLLQRRPGLHRGHPRARRPGRPRRLRRRARPSRRKGTKTGLPDDEDVALRPAQQRQPARPGQPASSTGCPTTPSVVAGGAPAGRPRATSTSRPSSPACSRTTR